MNPKDPDSFDSEQFNGQKKTKFGEGFNESAQTQQPQPPQQHKKQVRRRLHTSRPYQERLLNMAEARREIVTALKFHRAAMKQANEQRQKQQETLQQQQAQPLHLSPPACFEQESKMKSWRNPRIYTSTTENLFSYQDSFTYSSFPHYPAPPSNSFPWAASPIPPPSAPEPFNLTLPSQTLGLKLNFQDFTNLETTLYHNNSSLSSPCTYSPLSSSSSPGLSVTTTEEVPSVATPHEMGHTATTDVTESYGGGGLHYAMDDEEMAEIRLIGEQHQIERNNTMNSMTSAWWFKFLKAMEVGPEVKIEHDGYQPFDQVMEFPPWLNANESCLQQHLSDYCPDDYIQDPALPCMDIGEIEGIDGEWLA
ncbi:hypothetical protein SLE2022_038150 [Rubroshorea leprosula]